MILKLRERGFCNLFLELCIENKLIIIRRKVVKNNLVKSSFFLFIR